MICVVIKGPTFEEAREQITHAMRDADLVELRLDCFQSLDLNALKDLRAHFSIPMLFTLRCQSQGGSYTQSEEQRLSDLRRLAELKPEYLDLEHHVSLHFIQEIASEHPTIQLILSYHNFTETPSNLEGIYQEMCSKGAAFYKIATTASSSLDALRMLSWAQKYHDLIAISMGPYGQISRIIGPIIGCPITYAALDENQQSAPGQLSAKTLIKRYHHRLLNPHTALYGLIGYPTAQSISDETHNALIRSCGLDAVYVKIDVAPSELSAFLHVARQLPFHGLSVTMPLKEAILPFLDGIDASALDIQAVNTLLFQEGTITGYNTDGMGACNAIEREYPLKGKHVVIIGAGGAAKAIAYEAKQRGCQVTIVNRGGKRALQIAEHLNCIGKGLDYMSTCRELGYDILINCTPHSLPIAAEDILSEAVVMDITTRPKETTFLQVAKAKGCSVVYGYQMFIEQALGQFNLWFPNSLDIQECRAILKQKALEIL